MKTETEMMFSMEDEYKHQKAAYENFTRLYSKDDLNLKKKESSGSEPSEHQLNQIITADPDDHHYSHSGMGISVE